MLQQQLHRRHVRAIVIAAKFDFFNGQIAFHNAEFQTVLTDPRLHLKQIFKPLPRIAHRDFLHTALSRELQMMIIKRGENRGESHAVKSVGEQTTQQLA